MTPARQSSLLAARVLCAPAILISIADFPFVCCELEGPLNIDASNPGYMHLMAFSLRFGWTMPRLERYVASACCWKEFIGVLMQGLLVLTAISPQLACLRWSPSTWPCPLPGLSGSSWVCRADTLGSHTNFRGLGAIVLVFGMLIVIAVVLSFISPPLSPTPAD